MKYLWICLTTVFLANSWNVENFKTLESTRVNHVFTSVFAKINWWFSSLPSLKLTEQRVYIPLKIGQTKRTFHLPTIHIQKIWYILSGRIIFELNTCAADYPKVDCVPEIFGTEKNSYSIICSTSPTWNNEYNHWINKFTPLQKTNMPMENLRRCIFFLLMRFLGHCHSLVFGTFETPWKVDNRLGKILPKSPGLKQPGKQTQQSLQK